MKRYPGDLKSQVIKLRKSGKTYHEIRNLVKVEIPKSTIATWCRGIVMPEKYFRKVRKLNIERLPKARKLAVAKNKEIRKQYLQSLDQLNKPISIEIFNKNTAKIALSMLCLGEASKYKPRSGFYLGNSDYRIITLFIKLLKICFDYDQRKVRCTVQCRADQDKTELEQYWHTVTGISMKQFYKTRIDPRTIGKTTKRKNYKGVLRVDYLDTNIQLELESLANLVYNQVENNSQGPEV